MPNGEALQVFYGSLPLIGVMLTIYWSNQTALKDIQERLRAIEAWMLKVEKRLTALETRAGVIFHD